MLQVERRKYEMLNHGMMKTE